MTTTTALPDEISSRLRGLVELTGREQAEGINVIRDLLDDLEDAYIAEKRLIENRAGRSKTYTLDEVERRLGLAD